MKSSEDIADQRAPQRNAKRTKSDDHYNNSTKDEAAIRELIGGFVQAIRAEDIDGVMSVFARKLCRSTSAMKRWQELLDRLSRS